MLHFNRTYFLLTVLLFLIEVSIALFVKDNFIRPYFGDVLVVILIYCFLKSFFKWSVRNTCIAVLLFAFSVETLQYFTIVEKLQLQDNNLAKTVIGTSFAWEDIIAYVVGIVMVIVAERLLSKTKPLQ